MEARSPEEMVNIIGEAAKEISNLAGLYEAMINKDAPDHFDHRAIQFRRIGNVLTGTHERLKKEL